MAVPTLLFLPPSADLAIPTDQLYFSTAPFYSRLVLIRLSAVTFFFLVALRAYMLQRTIEILKA